MRFIQNDGLGARQQIAEALVLERQIREQQVMIHHHDVRRLRVAPRLEHMAARELRALLAEAILAGRGDARPQGRLLRQIGELGQIAGLGRRRPARNPRQHPRQPAFGAQQRSLLSGQFQTMAAQVIAAALEQGDLGGQPQRPGEQRHIAAKQLILQACACRWK